jgi:hypothetical protein
MTRVKRNPNESETGFLTSTNCTVFSNLSMGSVFLWSHDDTRDLQNHSWLARTALHIVTCTEGDLKCQRSFPSRNANYYNKNVHFVGYVLGVFATRSCKNAHIRFAACLSARQFTCNATRTTERIFIKLDSGEF